MKTRALIVVIATALIGVAACEKPADRTAENASAQAPAEGKSTESTSNNRDRYNVVSPGTSVNVGETQTVQFSIEPTGGLKINHDYPWKVTFEDTDGVDIASPTVGGSKIELADEAATIPVQLRASKDGDHKLAARGSFSVCNDTKCYVMRDEAVEFKLAAQTSQETEMNEGEN